MVIELNKQLPDHCKVLYEEFDSLPKGYFKISKKTFLQKQKKKRYLKNHRLKCLKKIKPKIKKHKDRFWSRMLNYENLSGLPVIDVTKASSDSKSTFTPIVVGGGMEHMSKYFSLGAMGIPEVQCLHAGDSFWDNNDEKLFTSFEDNIKKILGGVSVPKSAFVENAINYYMGDNES